jgi:PAS domain S-box-containing protein
VVTIIDTAGRVVARSADAERWVGRDLRGDPAVRRVLSRRAGAEELRGVDGAARLLAYLPTRDAPWIVYVGVPAAGVASSARERATRAAALGAAALASALLLAAFIARGIARPITRVTADALALGAGASAQRADVASAGPVRALAEGFNRMADALEASGRALAARTDALARTEARYRLLFEENPEPMWVFDVATLCFLAVNEAAVSAYGYPPEEFLALTIADIRPPEDIPLLRAALGQPGLPGPSRTQPGSVFRHRRRDGSILLVDVASHAIDFDGRAARLVLARDVTERSQLEAQLRQAQKMEAVGQLAGGVAHDFNNLLTIILSHAAFAREALADAPALAPVADDIGQVAHAATRATELTRQLLTFARRQMFAPRVLDVNDLTLHVDRMLRRLIGEHIELVTRCAPALWPAEADPAQIEQVLVNLAVNARDAMPDGGTLTIETSNATLGAADVSGPDARPGEYVVLEVRDTGHGIHPEDVGRLFEPFFTTKPPGAGTGLGLAVCYGIAAQHGGHITVESEPGRGATFRVYLPRSTRAAESPADDGAAPTPRGSETVLLVEDEAPVRAIAERALTSRGYTVLVAGDGEAGLRTVVEHDGPIHLLLTDVMMPRLGGRELAERATAVRPTLRVLYMSGYTENALAPDGVLGADVRFLPKPFIPAELLRAVRDALDE